MAEMERVDDFLLTLQGYDVDVATAQFLAAPRALRIIKAIFVETEAVTGADQVVTFTNEDGTDLDDTLTILLAGAAIGRVTEQHFGPGDANAFAIGDAIEFASGVAGTAGTGHLTLVCRPL